jgi:hypothetical protein
MPRALDGWNISFEGLYRDTGNRGFSGRSYRTDNLGGAVSEFIKEVKRRKCRYGYIAIQDRTEVFQCFGKPARDFKRHGELVPSDAHTSTAGIELRGLLGEVVGTLDTIGGFQQNAVYKVEHKITYEPVPPDASNTTKKSNASTSPKSRRPAALNISATLIFGGYSDREEHRNTMAIKHTSKANLYIFAVHSEAMTKMVGVTSAGVFVDGRHVHGVGPLDAPTISSAWDAPVDKGVPQGTYDLKSVCISRADSKRLAASGVGDEGGGAERLPIWKREPPARYDASPLVPQQPAGNRAESSFSFVEVDDRFEFTQSGAPQQWRKAELEKYLPMGCELSRRAVFVLPGAVGKTRRRAVESSHREGVVARGERGFGKRQHDCKLR